MHGADVVYSLCEYARKFIKEYKNHKLDQKVIDAIIVDYINYFVARHCGTALGMYTQDLRVGKPIIKDEIVLRKDIILESLNFYKDEYNKKGIMDSVNRNYYTNECGGRAEADNEDALIVIEEFIKSYVSD